MSQFQTQTLSDVACLPVINVHGMPKIYVINRNSQNKTIRTQNAVNSGDAKVVYTSKIGQIGIYACLHAWHSNPTGVRKRRQEVLLSMTTMTLWSHDDFSILFCISWKLRFKHYTYRSHFLRFIASTSGVEALHLSRSITLQNALTPLLSCLSVSRSLALCPSPSVFLYFPLLRLHPTC